MFLTRIVLFSTMLIAINTYVLSMEGYGNHQVLKEELIVPTKDFELFKKENGKNLYIPKRSYCQKAIDSYTNRNSLPPARVKSDPKTDARGGNGMICFTEDGHYAIKIGIDNNANNREKSSNSALEKFVDKINTVEREKGRPVAGFNINLPIKLLDIKCQSSSEKCTGSYIQIFPNEMKPDTHLGGGDRSLVAGIIRNYLKWNPGEKQYLSIMRDLGKKLAQFQKDFPINRDKHGKYYVGIQHGDFNPGNIFVTDINGDGTANFTLIDNEDFRTDGRLVSEPIYFVYWLGKVLLSEPGFIDINDDNTRNRVRNLIESFYSGYVKTLLPELAKEMKEKVFTNKDMPLIVAQSQDSFSSRYPKGFEEYISKENIWKKLLDEYQFDAFNKAYDEKYGSQGQTQGTISTGKVDTPQPSQAAQPSIGSSINRSNVPKGWGSNQTSMGGIAPKTVLNWRGQKIKSNEIDPMGLWKLETEGNLEELDLSDNPDIKFLDALGKLPNLKNLKKLNLSGTGIEAIWTLKPLTNLTTLDLSNNKNLFDVSHLGALTNLTTLDLSNTSVSKESAKELKSMLPKCSIKGYD